MLSKFSKKLKQLFKNKKTKCVSVIRLHGVIGDVGRYRGGEAINLHHLKSRIDKAFENKNMVAVALTINSPGGSPVQSELVANYIKHKAQKKKLPIYSFVEDVAASGGYWLACAGEKIYASENSIVGSIGVISAGFGFVEALKKLGIDRRVISQGKNKSVADPFLPIQKKDKDIIENIQKDIHQSFIDVVRESRGKKLKEEAADLFNGEFWTGKRALELGLVDQLADMYQTLEEEFGKDVKICEVTRTKSLLQKLLSVRAAGFDLDSLISRGKEEILWEKYDF